MSSRIFTVKFIAAKNNFCYLSSKNADFAEQGAVLKVTSVDSLDYYLTTILTTLKANVIGVNSLQAKLLNLNEGDDVMVTVCRDVSTLKKFTISPLTNDDYEILELLAENVETTLLNQIRVVNVNQKLIIWINDSLHLVANVDSTHPVNPGLIDNFTEVSIEFPKKRGEIVANTEKWSFKNFLHYFTKKDPQSDVRSNLNSYLNLHSSLVFRLHPVEDVVGECNEELIQHFNVFVREKDLPKYFIKINTSCNIHKMKVIIRPASTSYTGDSFSTVGEITIRLIILENSSNNLNFPTMYVHQCIFKNFNIKIGSKAFLSGCSKLHSPVTGVEILTSNGCKDGLEQFKSFLGGSQNLLLNSGVVLKIKSDFICSLKFTPSTSKFWFVTSDSVRNCKFKLSDVEVTQIEENVEKLTQDYFENFGNVREIIQDTLSVVSSIKMLENVLIVGKAGTGKSALTKVFSQKLARPPSYIYAEEISCKNLKGKSLDSLHKLLVNKFENLIFYQPSALIMDDLHVICEATNSEDELTPETLHFNRVSEMLSIMLEKLCKNHQIAVVATCESTFKLNRYIFASRGQQLFKNVFNLQPLTKEDRNRLIHHLFNQRLKLDPISVNVEQLSIKTEGFVVRDLVDFVDRAIFESIKEESKALDMPHCETALESISSLSLKDVNLHSPGERDFSDVGGMDDAKKTLIESMMWPVQYPNLFDNAPLRLQSGMLLYGPPGTGKTILAGAAAKQCGLRLISIKGPELLSKYIGASELAVRNVFEKAQSAKPCILFFDEFDSLAPRRGHDSTGVTDRVVNQLLTQLDGVESLSGVCVLAATSRPDLLDPALLRPGRLDKQIFCDLPNKETRLKILLVLSKNLSLSSDVDLLDVSEKTTRFSGADLQSLLYTAQLSALGNLSDELGSTTFTGIQINRNHVDEALKNTRPSLTKDEELKYKKIYSKFHQKSSTEDMKLGLQKATLA